MATSAFITGCRGLELSPEERAFLKAEKPAGLILFQRNCEGPDQVRRLTQSFRDAVGEQDTLVLIDQEGGRVQRLGPPHWRVLPPAAAFGALYAFDPAKGIEAARLAARLVARDLAQLGITMNCAPVVDLPVPGADGIIGNRAFCESPGPTIALAEAVARGLLAGGVLPCIKHIPGHGRAGVDSHLALPIVDAPLEELTRRDFRPFRELAHLPAAMTAHVVYTAIDPAAPATTSLRLIQDIIRGEIGFGGLLMSDDLSMQALTGTMQERTQAALHAGCDVVLHCTGDLAEMQAVAAAAGPMEPQARLRYAGCLALLGADQPFDAAAAERALEQALRVV
jgi:beta-N-acetylhexosaminidase